MTPHRLDELRDGGHTSEAGVRPVDPAGEIRRSSVCSKRINAIQKDRRRTGKRNLRSVAAGGQEAMHHHGAFTTDLGKGGIDPRPRFDPVGALINMKDFYVHTQLLFRTGPREPRLLRGVAQRRDPVRSFAASISMISPSDFIQGLFLDGFDVA